MIKRQASASSPSPELIALLDRLGLATADQVRGVRPAARQLAGDLPLFDSVWVDALVAARLVTPFQAAEVKLGRGERLAVGPYVLASPMVGLGYARLFAAREIATRRPAWLLLAETARRDPEKTTRELTWLVDRLLKASVPGVVPIATSGVEKRHVWAACPAQEATCVADWIIRNGRFPPGAVLEIACQMASALAALEQNDLVHGDLCLAGLWLTERGDVVLPMAGLRAILRPEEGFAHTDLGPEAYDYLAPERVADGTAPTTSSDLYACGCVWWHLLAGRGPLAGGNSLAKLKAAQLAKIADVRHLAPETPETLARAIDACTRREPSRRPKSFAEVATVLGPGTRQGRQTLAACLGPLANRPAAWATAADAVRHSRHTPVWLAAAVGGVLLIAAVSWPHWRGAVVVVKPAPAALEQPPEANPAEPALLAAPPPGKSAILLVPEKDQSEPDLVLPAGRTVDAGTLELRSGQVVRAESGQRATVAVPWSGLVVDVENIRFQNVDFVTSQPADGKESGAAIAALVNLRAGKAAFSNCSFHPRAADSRRWVAIAWTRPKASGDTDRLPGVGQIRLDDCAFAGVEVGIDCRGAGPLLMEMENTLHLGPGPLWRLNRCPAVDEPMLLTLKRCTLRGAASLVDFAYEEIDDAPAKVSIEATDCVFDPREGGSLVRLIGDERPERLLKMLEWGGEGSLMAHEAGFAIWYDSQSTSHSVDDTLVSVDGLVTGRFEFAGDAAAGPAASELVRWAAPLSSDQPPGVRAVGSLPAAPKIQN